MNAHRCLITYQTISIDEKYSNEGLRFLAKNLTTLSDLPFTIEELHQEAQSRYDKMSVQGVQPKLSAKLNIQQGCFEIVDTGGTFILKPSLLHYPEVPANEDVTMKMAVAVGIEVPIHGLLYNRDGTLTYFIKRFDRLAHKNKCAVEDFAQLTGNTRDTKYQFSMEKLVSVLDQYCTFPMLEKHKLFIRVIFNYLVGNEDMHLKNFSLITRNKKVELAPAYDFLNTTILLPRVKEELALPLNGKKNHLSFKDFIDYFAYERLSLNEKIVMETLKNFQEKSSELFSWVDRSFLSEKMKASYKDILMKRFSVLFGNI